MKKRITLLIAKLFLWICLLVSFPVQSQVQIGLKKVNVFTDISYSSPEKELKNYYSLGDLMKIYVGVEVPFLAVNYNKKTQCV